MPEDMALQERADPPSENWNLGHMESEHIYANCYKRAVSSADRALEHQLGYVFKARNLHESSFHVPCMGAGGIHKI